MKVNIINNKLVINNENKDSLINKDSIVNKETLNNVILTNSENSHILYQVPNEGTCNNIKDNCSTGTASFCMLTTVPDKVDSMNTCNSLIVNQLIYYKCDPENPNDNLCDLRKRCTNKNAINELNIEGWCVTDDDCGSGATCDDFKSTGEVSSDKYTSLYDTSNEICYNNTDIFY